MINNDLIVLVGTVASKDDSKFFQNIQTSVKNGASLVLFSVMEDLPLMKNAKAFCRYEAGSEEGVVALLTKSLVNKKTISPALLKYFEELDEGYISAETNVGEEEIEELIELLDNSKNPLIVFGKDMFIHERAQNISKLIKIFKDNTNIEVMTLNELNINGLPEDIEVLHSFDGTIVFNYKSLTDDIGFLYGSKQFSIAAKLQNNQNVEVKTKDGISDRQFVLDEKLKGTVALMPMSEESSKYRYKVAKITKREVQ